MASGSAKDGRKRKRAQDTHDAQSQTTKKVKSDGKITQPTGQFAHANVDDEPSPLLPHTPDSNVSTKQDHKNRQSAEGTVGKQAKQKSKKESGRLSVGATNDTQEEQLADATSKSVQTKTERSKKSKSKSKGITTHEDEPQVEQDAESQLENDKHMARKLERKRQKLVKKFTFFEEQQHDNIAADEKLQHLLEKTKKLIKKHGLGQDDELVRIRDRHSSIRRDLWQVSRPFGGRFINHDPVFSKDEKYIILATSTSIHVYEAENSLLVRTITVTGILCYALSVDDPHHLYIGNSSGEIRRFDWTTGDRIATINAGKGRSIRSVTTVRLQDSSEEALFTIETVAEGKKKGEVQGSNANSASRDILVARKAPWNGSDEAHQVLHKASSSLLHLKILDRGKVVVVTDGDKMVIGKLSGNMDISSTSFASLKSSYTWRYLDSTHTIVCLDAYFRTLPSQDKAGGNKEGKQYDLAIGNAKGEILIFDNIIHQLEKIEEQGSNKTPHARVLRWHRQAPNAVKWSKDGNYLLSGGKETVLCLWQLETGRRQELPHLTAAIQSLVVSPSGTSYGIQLSDNSVIMLSTAELQPKTHIAGLQSLYINTSRVAGKEGLSASAKNLYSATPMLNNPRNSKDLLLAVPVDQQVMKTTKSTPAAPFLQTYDLQAARHVTRQALTRNLVTEINIDPDWNKIEIPNVTLMQISHDGTWLATVEEWTPPAHALQHLAFDKEELEAERRKRRESYLKIWRWDEKSKTWALNTRVDKPHADESNEQANRTFHIVSHPTKAGFATIGEDSSVRIWRPRPRKTESVWVANSVFKLEKSAVVTDEAMDFPLPATPVVGRLAYSNDGSVLAVSQQDTSSGRSSVVHMLDAETGIIRSAETGLAVGYLVSMAFLGRYLILLSDELRVWDVVTGTLMFTRPVSNGGSSLPHRLATSHLAVSVKSGTFAVAGVNATEGRYGSSVLVLQPTRAEPIFTFHLDTGAVSALATLVDGSGYVVLDSLAVLRRLSTYNVPILGGPPKTTSRLGQGEAQATEIDDDDLEAEQEDVTGGAEKATSTLGLEDDRQVLKSEQLAQVFAASSEGFGLPSVKEMFDSVAGLFAVKAR